MLLAYGLAACLWLGALGNAAWAQTSTLLANAGPEKRYALLIGNADYSSAPLTNPVNDVRSMALSLQAAGFDVTTAENAGRRRMLNLVREFGDKLRLNGGVGLFYFAGHGLQIKGRNYLVPVDAQVSGEDEASFDSMDTDLILTKMGEAKNRVNVIILDACRNNPFVKTRSTSGGGLAQIDAPVGALVAYATAPGSVASDGAGANGLYTEHLVRAINQKGLPIEEVFKQVRANVRRDSQGKQIPWENTALEGQFYFFPPESVSGVQQANPHANVPAGAAVLEAGGAEQGAWELARVGTLADAERFLQRYPSGRHAQDARTRLAALRAQVEVVAAPAGMPPRPPAMPAPLASPAVMSAAADGITQVNASKISLQTLSAMAKPVPSAASVGTVGVVAPTAAPAPALVNAGAQVWNYVVSSADGKEQAEQIRVLEVSNGWQRLSNGSEIHVDGRVRAVRFGSYMVKAVSDDSFLRLPVKSGLSGANTALVTDAQGRGVNARVIWRTESAGETVKLIANIDGVSFVLRYEAFFAVNQLLPLRYESEMKSRFAGGSAQTMTARLQQ